MCLFLRKIHIRKKHSPLSPSQTRLTTPRDREGFLSCHLHELPQFSSSFSGLQSWPLKTAIPSTLQHFHNDSPNDLTCTCLFCNHCSLFKLLCLSYRDKKWYRSIYIQYKPHILHYIIDNTVMYTCMQCKRLEALTLIKYKLHF